jgi:hypothetical protein
VKKYQEICYSQEVLQQQVFVHTQENPQAFSDNHIARLSAMYEHISAICLQVTVVHYLKMSCEIAVKCNNISNKWRSILDDNYLLFLYVITGNVFSIYKGYQNV